MRTGRIIIVLMVAGLVYWFLEPTLKEFYLKKNGICIDAKLSLHTNRIKYHKAELLYTFTVNDDVYQGNSLETDKRKAGEMICVLYLKDDPSVSRPIIYFDDHQNLNCHCK